MFWNSNVYKNQCWLLVSQRETNEGQLCDRPCVLPTHPSVPSSPFQGLYRSLHNLTCLPLCSHHYYYICHNSKMNYGWLKNCLHPWPMGLFYRSLSLLFEHKLPLKLCLHMEITCIRVRMPGVNGVSESDNGVYLLVSFECWCQIEPHTAVHKIATRRLKN